MSSNRNDHETDDEKTRTTRRSVLGASATAPLAFWDDWSMFADEGETEFDILRILDSGTPVAEGTKQINFGDNLTPEQTGKDVIRVDAAASGGSGGATRLEDLEDVDVTGWLEGPIADRPASDDLPAGVRYEATDQDITYRNTSSNGWVATGGTGTADNPVPEQHVQSFSTVDASITGNFNDVEQDTLTFELDTHSIDNLNTITNGAGQVNTSGGIRYNVEMGSSPSAGDWALAEDATFAAWNFPSWDKRRVTRISWWLDGVAEQASVGTGRININNKSQAGIGCLVDANDLYAFCSDGSSHTQTLMRSSITDGAQHEIFIDFDGNPSGSGTATITVKEFPTTGSTTPNWTETHTFDASNGDTLPSGKDGNNNMWNVWSGMVKTPNALASLDLHINKVQHVMFPDSA